MARGGYRPGAGRPKGSRSVKEGGAVPADIRRAAREAKLSPLEYMLGVMNDEDAAPERRDRMAIAAAPFVHARASDEAPGKKERQAAAARAAATGRFAPPPPPKLVVDNG